MMKNNLKDLKEIKSTLSNASTVIQLKSTMDDNCIKTLDEINRAYFTLVRLIKEYE